MRKKKYKALMLDLDGTTIPNRKDGLPSQVVIDAIRKADQFVAVGIITGRTYKWAIPIMKHLKLSAPSIVAGGAQVIDSTSGEILHEKRIPNKSNPHIQEILKRLQLSYVIPTEDSNNIVQSDYYDLGAKDLLSIGITDLTDERAESVLKMLQKDFNLGKHKIVGWKPNTFWVQITHAEATKQNGILQVAKILNIEPNDIIGVGDGYNDFPLLMACGLKVAMGNAVPELKAIADYIAPSVEEDGVADVIEKFIL